MSGARYLPNCLDPAAPQPCSPLVRLCMLHAAHLVFATLPNGHVNIQLELHPLLVAASTPASITNHLATRWPIRHFSTLETLTLVLRPSVLSGCGPHCPESCEPICGG